MELIITKDLVDSINSALDKGLVSGVGKPVEGKMCVEALICSKLGLPHSDNPPCVGSEVRLAKIELNDCNWSSNQARAEGMRKLAVAQLGSNNLDQDVFSLKLKLASTKVILPFLIQKHYEEVKDEKLLEWKHKFEALAELDDVLLAKFYNSYNSYNNYNYYSHHYYYYNYYYNYYNYFGDKFLLLIADTILQVLIDMKSPGCEWIKSSAAQP